MRLTLPRVLAFLVLLPAAACTSLPPGAALPKTPSNALAPSTDSTLGRTFGTIAKANDGNSGFQMISAGIDGLTARVEMIDAAQRSLDLQYYIFHSDDSGNLIAEALLRAAARGVRIRILRDDAETVAGDERLLALAASTCIQVRIFNPLRYRGHSSVLRGAEFLFDRARLDYRMHNKLMVADNAAAIIGGRNIGNQYFQIDPNSQFGDDDVVVAGPMVQQLSGVFDEFWNSRLAVPAQAVDKRHTSDRSLSEFLATLAAHRQRLDAIHTDQPQPAPKEPFSDIASGRTPLIWAHSQLAYDSPEKKAVENGTTMGSLIYAPVAERANAVSSEMLVVSPYFIPAPDELAILKGQRARNVHVRVLTNSLESAPDLAAHSGYMHHRIELLNEGVELHEVRALLGSTRGSGQNKKISRRGNYGLHGKLYVFDRKTLFIGSMNFDERSRHLNTEIGLLIESAELSREVAVRFDALTQLDNAYALSLSEDTAGNGPRLVWTTRVSGTVVKYETEPARSAWQRMRVNLLTLLPLDREL